MKETIYTIPINDAYDELCGCPICRLEQDLEQASVEYIMGAAMMEPDVRAETNRHGFCPHHFADMMNIQKRLSLSLILESYLNELLEGCFPENPEKLTKKSMETLCAQITDASNGCFVCDQLRDRMEKYYQNILYLWKTDPAFREKTRNQEYFCPAHLARLLQLARQELDKKNSPLFFADHLNAARGKLSELSTQVFAFCKSFDHRYADIPLGDAKHAIENTIAYLNGNKK